MKEVLPSAFLYKSFEDSRGYTWFLTDNSITRFDGKKAKRYGASDGYFEGGAYHMLEDDKGLLWFVSKNFKLYVFANNQFTLIKTEHKLSWVDIGTDGKVRTMSRSGKVLRILPDLTLRQDFSISQGMPYSFTHIGHDSFMMSTANGVWICHGQEKTLLLPAHTYYNYITARIFKFAHRIFITTDNGLYEYRNKRPELIYPLSNREVFSVVLDTARKCFWLGTGQGIMRICDASPRKCSFYLPNYLILSVNLLKNGNLWFATSSNGVFIHNPDALHYTSELQKENIRAVKKESDALYFFVNNEFFYRIHQSKLKQYKFREKGGSELPREINWVKSASDSQIWITSVWDIPAYTLMISKGKVSTVKSLQGSASLPYKSTNDVLLAHEQNFYLNSFDNRKISKEQYQAFSRKVALQNNAMEQEAPLLFSGDTAYFSCTKGLVKVYWKNRQAIYRTFPVKGIISQVIADGSRIFVSTETNGIYLIDPGKITNLNTDNLLLSNYCNNIYLRPPFLWATTNSGVFRMNLETGKAVNFTSFDYLVSSETNDLEFFHDSVYVATNKGVSFFPEHVAMPEASPRILLEKLLVNDQPRSIPGQHALDYLSNNISMHFTSPGYRSAAFNTFRIILNSNDRVDTSYYTDGNVQLLALTPGAYTLVADVKNLDGMWSNKPVTLLFTIAPPFWKTWWFITLTLIAMMAVAAYQVWISVKRHKEAQEYNRKIAESELKSLRLYMNPHFLFNSLTSLQSFVLTHKTTEANQFITRFSRLIRAVMTYSVRGELKLSEEVELLNNYLELECVRFGTAFEYRVSAADNINPDGVIIPSLIIQPFVENAIKHGVTGVTDHACYIRVHFFMQHGDLYCTISDNGRGRAASKKNSEYHISSGIRFTEERIRLLVKDKQKAVIRVQNTSDDKIMPGTTVTVLVPQLNNTEI